MKNSLKQGKPLIWFARRQGTQRLKIQRLRDSFFSSSPSPPGQTVRGQATRRPPHLRPPRVRGLGVRWATEDSAGPRPAPRASLCGGAAATGSAACGVSIRVCGVLPRGGPAVGGPSPSWEAGRRGCGVCTATRCASVRSSSELGRTGRSSRGVSLRSRGGRVALALRVGLREGGNFRGGTLVSLPGKCLSFWIAGPAREELVQTSLERRRLSPRARRVPRTLRARGGAITNTAGTKKRSRSGFYRKTLRPDFVSGRVSFRAGKLVSLLRT